MEIIIITCIVLNIIVVVLKFIFNKYSLYYFDKTLSKIENTSEQIKFDIMFRAFMYYYNTI